MRSRIDQNEEDIGRLESENEDQEETIESLTAQVRELQAWRRRHDFLERVGWISFLIIFLGLSIAMYWLMSEGLL